MTVAMMAEAVTMIVGMTIPDTDWSFADVPPLFERVWKLADDCGYLASLFGSVVKAGKGRDLDILLTPYANREQDKERFGHEFGGQVERKFIDPERGKESYEVRRGGRIYHFVFGLVRKKSEG
jgi:hypothetical protein